MVHRIWTDTLLAFINTVIFFKFRMNDFKRLYVIGGLDKNYNIKIYYIPLSLEQNRPVSHVL